MKRRNKILAMIFFLFITLASLVAAHENEKKSEISKNSPMVLKDFNESQEENPQLVSDGNGSMWLFSLRRNEYPKNSEVISAFKYLDKKWIEIEDVTKQAGMYETQTSACAADGQPVVAWAEKKGETWDINVSVMEENKMLEPYTFPVKAGRSINPVLIAPDKVRNWIAWENYYNGKFSIYISKYVQGEWTQLVIIDKGKNSCFSHALAEAEDGNLYVVYGLTDGYHQNIEMSIIDGNRLEVTKTVPIAIGGGFVNRINLNTNPALAFDKTGRLWISYENNRHAHRLNDGDNYTGDRYCAILSYKDGKVVETESGKWLFSVKNDHKPTFVKDNNGSLYIATHCGGDFKGNPFWSYRLSGLDPQKGWLEPTTILTTKQKGSLIPPAVAFDENNKLWLATSIEKNNYNKKHDHNSNHGHSHENEENVVRSRLTQLTVQQVAAPKLSGEYASINFNETIVKEHRPDDETISTYSGHPRITDEEITVDGEKYKLIYGNLHEHTESSSCWPAGTDGTLHEDFRFGMFTEGYDFWGISDHGYTMTEVYWRKYIRLADFYTVPDLFVSIPSMEWTLRSAPKLDSIQHGAGHYNVIFASTEDGRKFIRNKEEIFSVYTPESNNSEELWKLLDEKGINCVTIPHHPADETHPLDWNVHDEDYVTVVELFQCRGNSEYPGCPREYNLDRHRPTVHKRSYVNYALKEKKYKMGFIASGDHNSMGIGVAALWVKEFSREGIIDALKNRRTFATTGDKMIMDFRMNGGVTGSTISNAGELNLSLNVKGQRELVKVEILRNSDVVKEYKITDGSLTFNETYTDENPQFEKGVLYYYIRATQKNNEIAWSSPIWVDEKK